MMMSRNNKNARLHAEAREMSKQHKSGNKGPAKTTPAHGKVNVRWRSKDAMAARTAVMTRSRDTRTVLEKLKGIDD